MNTEQKCICLEDNKLTQALCPVHSKRHTEQKCCDHFKYNYYFKGCACTAMGQPCHTEQKGWREEAADAGDLFGRKVLTVGQVETILTAQREEMVKTLNKLKIEDGFKICRHQIRCNDPEMHFNSAIEACIALIKDKI